MTLLEDVSAADVVDGAGAPHRRAAVFRDLVESFETYFAEHHRCAPLGAGIVEAEQRGAPWAVAWLTCGCGLRWERHRKLHA